MSELEEKLGQVLSNPQMMQQIMSLAQSLGSQNPQPSQPEPKPDPPVPSGADLDMVRKVANMASATGVDQNQRSLLRALSPYISRERSRKLEKAMRAAKMAAFASSMLSAQNGRAGHV